MEIQETIRTLRAEKGLTQEQVAKRLGVSAPAVSKWETGASYPDITLLAPLARLLGVDLNTLLTFEGDLDDQGINEIMEELRCTMASDGIDDAYKKARDAVSEYPASDKLALTVALSLDGWSMLESHPEKRDPHSEAFVESLYEQASKSDDPPVRYQATCMIANRLRARGEFDRAKELIDSLPEETGIDKTQLRATLCIEQGDLEQAAALTERKLLQLAESVQSALLVLLDIALKQGRTDEARLIVDVSRDTARLLALPECRKWVGPVQLCLAEKDAEGLLDGLEKLLASFLKQWDGRRSPLYRHAFATNEQDGNRGAPAFGTALLEMILSELDDPDNEEYAFIRDEPRFKKILASTKTKMR